MVELGLTIGVFIYLLVPIVIIFLAWSILENKKRSKKFVEEEVYIWYCDICGSTYIDTMHVKLSRCPQCDSYIEKTDLRRQKTDFRNQKEG